MAAKNKSLRKRGRECLEMNEREEDQEPPIIIANIKRRKRTRDGVKTENENESASTELLGNSITKTTVCKTTTSIVTLRRNSNSDSGWEHSISTSSVVNVPPKKEQNLASNVKKTYASGSKQIYDKNEREKTKRNSRFKSSLCDQPSKEEEIVSEIEASKIKEEDTGKGADNDTMGNSVFPSEGGVSDEVKVSIPRREDVVVKDDMFPDEVQSSDNCQPVQMVNKDGVWKNENECTVYVSSDISPESKTFLESIAKNSSKITVSEDFKAIESEMTPTGNYNVLATISSNIHMPHGHHSLPPSLRSVNSPRIPVTPAMPNLNANTSAITSIPTPIATFPVLPDMTRDASGGTVFTVGIDNSDTKQEDYYPNVTSSASSFACSSHNSLNLVASNPTCGMIAVDKNNLHFSRSDSSRETEDHKNIHQMVQRSPPSIPLVQIDDDSESLLIERDTTQVSVGISAKVNSTSERSAISTSFGVTSNGRVHNSPNFLWVVNWATYLLERLELLYKGKQECDLVLKFSSGETLKVHRAIVLACTSLLSEPNLVQREGEFAMPSDLNYASAEPVIRFLYSGRLDVRGSPPTEVSAIYATAERFQVPLLTRLMERRFPYLSSSSRMKTRLPIWKRSPEKLARVSKQHTVKACNKNTNSRILSPSDKPSSGRHIPTIEGEYSFGTSREAAEGTNTKESAEGTSVTVEEDEGQDGSVYLLETNSQKIAQANAAVRRKKPAEEARPTRFELEEDLENASVRIAPWSSKSQPLSPLFVTTCVPSQDGIISSCSSSFTSAESLSSNPLDISHFPSRAPQCTARYKPSVNSNIGLSLSTSNNSSPSQDPFSLLTQVVSDDQSTISKTEEENVRKAEGVSISPNSKSPREQEMIIEDDDTIGDDDIGKDSDELMEKISSICKQLEERDSDENESVNKEVFVACDYKMETVDCETPLLKDNPLQVSHVADGENHSDSNDPFVLSNTSVPVKSILKKKKDKSDTNKLKKHVSFHLDENNELITEVATYSHAKEPAQSLIEVQKAVGSFKSNDNSYSPVKLNLSLKKKVLINLSLDDSEASESPSHEDEKGKDKKDGCSSSQSTSQGQVRKGYMSDHAKLIKKVLRRYPNLVKDQQSMRVKVFEMDKAGGGKMVESNVQYLVLNESESKTKPNTKLSKATSGPGTKGDSNTSNRTMQNSQTFECPECKGYFFPSYFTFKKHVSAEHKDKSSAILASIENVPYACYTCFLNEPLEFSDYCSYQQHMKDVHSKSEARLCSMCGFRPVRKLELAYHQYTEHNKVPRNITFPKCDLCDHIAINDAALLKHRSRHANADNYTCSVCGVAFCSFGALQGHMQTRLCQTKPSISHKCPHCPLTFSRSYNLKAHCKFSHRAIQTTVQVTTGSAGEQTGNRKQEGASLSSGETAKPTETNLSTDGEQSELNVEGMCETLTSMSSQSSSEAEALSTVANSLAASLGLPEETMNHYMYTQGGKLDFSGSLDGEKYEEGITRTDGVSVHLVDATTSVSNYQGEIPVCNDRTYTSQASMPSTTSVGTLYPVGVVPSHLVSNQLVPGQILPSQMLQGGCISTNGGSVLGTAPHSWTYVTYQVPTTTDDLPAVITEAATLNTAPINPDQSSGTLTPDQSTASIAAGQGTRVEVALTGKSSEDDNVIVNECEQENPLVVMANTATQVDISQTSNLPATHSYDAFSSQFV